MKRTLIMCTTLLLAILNGCAPGTKLSADDLISKVVAADQKAVPYESEGSMRFYENGKLIEDSTYIGLYDPENGRVRIETKTNGKRTISLNDGENITFYEPDKKTALVTDALEPGAVGDISIKNQTLKMIDSVRKTHELETLQNEKVAGRDTYHIRMTPKEKGTLYGTQELWIDSKTWNQLKAVVETGDTKMELEITHFNDSPNISDDSFKLQLPEDVKVTPMDELISNKNVTLQEAVKALGKPFYYWDAAELKIESVQLNELKGNVKRNEVTVNYMKDGTAFVSLSIFPAPPKQKDNYGMLDVKPVEVRGQKGVYEESLRFITWDEDGLRYSLQLVHPDLSLEEALDLAGTMKPAS